MAESARHLVEDVFGPRPVRQWVLSVPFRLRWLFASKPQAIGPVLAIVQRVIGNWLADQAGIDRAAAQCGAVTLIQRFGSALNLNVHFDVHGRTNAAGAWMRGSGPHAVARRRPRGKRRAIAAQAAPASRPRAQSHPTH